MTKLQALDFQNFRGIRSETKLDLPSGQSLLLYGDNGTGKSSLLDAIEWFISDQVAHLAGEEIETHGGIRNALSPKSEACFVGLSLSSPQITKKKSLVDVKGKLRSEFEGGITPELQDAIDSLGKERLWIRNKDLVEFVLGSKTERLNDLSAIIGFEPVSNTKTALKKAANDVRTVIKTKNFEGTLSSERRLIAENLGVLVHTEEQFLNAGTALIKTVAPEKTLTKMDDIAGVIKDLSAGHDSAQAKSLRTLLEAQANGTSLGSLLSSSGSELVRYISARDKIKEDKDRLKQVSLSKLLLEAQKVLASHEKDDCPLCLQLISREELKKKVVERIASMRAIEEELSGLESSRRLVSTALSSMIGAFDRFVAQLDDIKTGPKAAVFDRAKVQLQKLKETQKDLQASPLSQESSLDAAFFIDLEADITDLTAAAKTRSDELAKEVSDVRMQIVAKLSVAQVAFKKALGLVAEQNLLNTQSQTLDLIVTDFIAKQKEGMSAFLESISKAMNEYYQFMNADEKVENIELVCLDNKDGEFVGVAVNFKFHGEQVASPRKFLSESHINCLGLCLFLSTARAFNKRAKFLVLDDVISSFDKNHRTLFARLLTTKFDDFQLLVLTHETEWFEYFSTLTKAPAWRVLRTSWDPISGTSLNIPSGSLRQQIDEKVKKNDESDLGNLLRRYGERALKEIAVEIEAGCAFRMNDRNESRTFDELYGAIRGQVRKSSDFSDDPAIAALATCQFFSNKTSHDSGVKANIADLKVALRDLDAFVAKFKCQDCGRLVSKQFENLPEKKITCKCGKHAVKWK